MPESSPGPDPAEVAWNQFLTACDRLADAGKALREAGGSRKILARMRPSSIERAMARADAAWSELDDLHDTIQSRHEKVSRPRRQV